jgi:hypothetical protein
MPWVTASTVLPLLEDEPLVGGPLFEGSNELWGHDRHVGSLFEQPEHLVLGDRFSAHDEATAAQQAQRDGIQRAVPSPRAGSHPTAVCDKPSLHDLEGPALGHSCIRRERFPGIRCSAARSGEGLPWTNSPGLISFGYPFESVVAKRGADVRGGRVSK